MELPEIGQEALRRIASLVAIGRKSGDTVVGLSAVRRTAALAYLFIEGGVAANTQRELEGLQRRGVRVLRAGSLLPLTRGFGREEVKIVGVKPGSLAEGIGKRLEGGSGAVSG